MKAYRRREVLKLLGTTVIYEVTFGLSGCLGNKGEPYESSDIESKKAELEETIKRETAQKTKNIWTVNPDYAGRRLNDFVIPDKIKGNPISIEGDKTEYGEIKEMGLSSYGEFYNGGRLEAVLYYDVAGSVVSLSDQNGDGIIDYVMQVIMDKDGVHGLYYKDEDGSGNLKPYKPSLQIPGDPEQQIENAFGNESSRSTK